MKRINKRIIDSGKIQHCFFSVFKCSILSALISVSVLASFVLVSCNEEDDDTEVYYIDDYSTLYSYLEDNTEYSLFKSIIDSAVVDGNTMQTMASVYSSYNSNSGDNDYTLFLPTNEAINEYLEERGMTIGDLLSSSEKCWDLAANHLINMPLYSQYFPNGQISESSISGDFHTVRYESAGDGVVYYLDGDASVLIPDITVSNGVIHVINKVLVPITYTSCEWIEDNSDYQIFTEALKITGIYDLLQSLDPQAAPITMFVESDQVFNQAGINSLDDLIAKVSPDESNYTDNTNPLYEYIAYHVIKDKALYLTDMSDGKTNYSTYTTYPLTLTLDADLSHEDGLSVGVAINEGFVVYDTLVSETNDTTIIDYVSIYETNSNKPTLSGVLHFVNYVLEVDTNLTAAMVLYDFSEDPVILQARNDDDYGVTSFDDADLERFVFGGELNEIFYYITDDASELARNKDYIFFKGMYEISYTITPLLQGNYTLQLRMNADKISGLVDVYLDDKKVGSTINLNALEAPNTTNSYLIFSVGDVVIEGYNEHVLTLKAITPGAIFWDYIRFRPI